jgi:hypothetical protein
MIIMTCAPSPGGLPADARNFSFRMRRAGAIVFCRRPIPIAEARDSGQQ